MTKHKATGHRGYLRSRGAGVLVTLALLSCAFLAAALPASRALTIPPSGAPSIDVSGNGIAASIKLGDLDPSLIKGEYLVLADRYYADIQGVTPGVSKDGVVLNISESGKMGLYWRNGGEPIEAVKLYLAPNQELPDYLIVDSYDREANQWTGIEPWGMTVDNSNHTATWRLQGDYKADNLYFHPWNDPDNHDGQEGCQITITGFEIYSKGRTPADFETSGIPGVWVAPPVISPEPCEFFDPLTVTMSAGAGCTVYYTTDGSEPVAGESNTYKEGVVISGTTTFKALAADASGHTSGVAEATYTCTRHGIGEGYDPSSPGNPQMPDTTTYYTLTCVVNPVGTGSVGNASQRLPQGKEVNVTCSGNNGFRFVNWTLEGDAVSEERSFRYVMPAADVTLVANFVYDPSSPGNPEAVELAKRHPVTASATPAAGGRVSPEGEFALNEGESRQVYAYPSTGWELTGWTVDGRPYGEAVSPLTVTMAAQAIDVKANFRYNPGSPGNPGSNSYYEDGVLVVDDFRPGNLHNAIQQALRDAGKSSADVGKLIVGGRMNGNDMGAFNYIREPQCIDLSRTGGLEELGNWAFANMQATEIILPSTVTKMGQYVFNQCPNLTQLTVFALEPPACDKNTFSNFGNKKNCTVYVPAGAISLYAGHEIWKEFDLVPITSDVHTLTVRLPEAAADGKYRNCRLELANTATGVKQQYVVSDRTVYLFGNLLKDENFNVTLSSESGMELGRIDNVTMTGEDMEVEFESLKAMYRVAAVVSLPDGTDATLAVTVEWLMPQEEGNPKYLRKGAELGEMPEGEALVCRVTLPQDLGTRYAAPADISMTVNPHTHVCKVQLAPFRTVALSGEVYDTDGMPLGNAGVAAVQTLNGKYSKTSTARTDLKGAWSLEVYDAPGTTVTWSAPEYVSRTDTVAEFDPEAAGLNLGRVELRPIAGARLNCSFTFLEAGADEPLPYYSDMPNVLVSVHNVTQNRSHDNLSLQYPVVAVLDEGVNPGDELLLTASSKTNAFKPVTATVTLGENLRADATFNLLGKGGIKALCEPSETLADAMLYSEAGQLLGQEDYSDNRALFSGLDGGSYKLVSISRSDLMGSVLKLASFAEAGLEEGSDYLLKEVTVEDGKVTEVKFGEVPTFDESRFYYTSSSASFTANKSSITTGNYLTLRATLDFKPDYAQQAGNVRLVVDLPEACELVEQSVIQGTALLPYTLDGKRLTVPLGNDWRTQVRFCVIPTAGGKFASTASAMFDLDGKTVTQPFGTATSDIKDLEIYVPASTASTEFTVIGKGRPQSDVKVYIDGYLNAVAKVNAVGDWSAECTLTEPENFSQHPVYAEFSKAGYPTVQCETKTVTYNPMEVSVKTVEMTFWNSAHVTQVGVTWDFTTGKASTSSYGFYSTTEFTFLIDIDYRDRKVIPFVWLHVYTSDGKVTSLRADYDEKSDKWVASSQFTSRNLPTRVAVAIENMMFNIAEEVDYEFLIDEYVGEINRGETTPNPDGSETTGYTDGNGNPLIDITTYEPDKPVDDVIKDLKEQGFEEDETLDGDDGDYEPVDEDDTLDGEDVKTLVDPKDGSIAMVWTGGKPKVAIIRVIREEDKKTSIELVSSTISRTWRSFVRSYFDPVACAQVTEYRKYTEHLEKYIRIITSSLVAHAVLIDYRLLPPGTKIPKKQVLAKIRRIRHFSKKYTTSTIETSSLPRKCTPPPPPPPPTPPVPPVNPILDPSGYVYEAVPANRVQGVQASIYYKETKEDMYGDPYEDVVLWDAEEYAQKNPLFTDEFGMYQWDVPQGLWQVKFEKEGYETAHSEWLPVPPPQLDVNVAITQNKQPEVIAARAYDDGVEVAFDKYMDPATLTADNVFVTAAGNKVEGTVTLTDLAAADEFADPDDAGAVRYASALRFVPKESLAALDGEILLTVSRNVLSYAGIPMAATYSQALDVEKEVKEIYAEDVKVLYGGEREITVYGIPAEAAANRTVRVESASELIATAAAQEVTLDADGKGTLKIRGELPGVTSLRFTIEGVTAEGEAGVEVVTDLHEALAPVASRPDGTAVYRGTAVSLETATDGGVIYYTTDGSCPCDDNGTRLVYDKPIVIDSDMEIRAMTVGSGEDEPSETVVFRYTVKRAKSPAAFEEGWTWMSHGLDEAVELTALTSAGTVDRVLGHEKEAVRDPQLGVVGTLAALEPVTMYKVHTAGAASAAQTEGYAIDPTLPVAVAEGWNWLGYTPDYVQTPDDALTEFHPSPLDMIVGQEGFAQYDGRQWTGTLGRLTPGQGYLYRSASARSLSYTLSGNIAKAPARTRGTAEAVRLEAMRRYPAVMPLTLGLADIEGTPLPPGAYELTAMCGDEVRGTGTVVGDLVMMSVHGNPGDAITLAATDAVTGEAIGNDAGFTLREDAVGDIQSPHTVHLLTSGVRNAMTDGEPGISLAGDRLYVTGCNPADVEKLEMFDLAGLRTLNETRVTEAGVKTSGMLPGVYTVRLHVNGKTVTRKINLQ